MGNREESKGQRIKVRNFEQERREELLPLLIEVTKELEACGPKVPELQQTHYDSMLQVVRFYKDHLTFSRNQQNKCNLDLSIVEGQITALTDDLAS